MDASYWLEEEREPLPRVRLAGPPDVVVVGGGVIAAGEMLLEPARREMLARALSPSREHVRVVAARFGEEAGMLGASLVAWEHAR